MGSMHAFVVNINYYEYALFLDNKAPVYHYWQISEKWMNDHFVFQACMNTPLAACTHNSMVIKCKLCVQSW